MEGEVEKEQSRTTVLFSVLSTCYKSQVKGGVWLSGEHLLCREEALGSILSTAKNKIQ